MTTTIDVRFYELDPYGHVNHGVYLNYFEVARIELLERIGFGLPRLRELGRHIVVVEVQVRYHAPAVAGDRLEVTTEVADIKRASSVWHQRILRGAEVIATNRLRAAITDTSGRVTTPPAGFVDALEGLRAPR